MEEPCRSIIIITSRCSILQAPISKFYYNNPLYIPIVTIGWCLLITNDRYDVHMEYKSSTQQDNSQSWYFTDLEDSRLNILPPNTSIVDPNNTNRIITGEGAISDNGSNLVTLFEIFTTSGYDETKITADHNRVKSQKYMMLPTDWVNFEITVYIHCIMCNPSSRIEFYGRGGRHINGRSYEGTKYDLVVTADGHLKGNIKHFHSAGLELLQDNAVLGDIEGKRIGIKFIIYNNSNESNPSAVKIEGLVDRFSDNIWEKVYEYTDTGSKNLYLKYGDASTNMITWGGPIIGIKVINFPSGGLAIDKLSVREIDALSPKITIPPIPAPIDIYYVIPPTTPPSTALRIGPVSDTWDDDLTYPNPPWGDPGDP